MFKIISCRQTGVNHTIALFNVRAVQQLAALVCILAMPLLAHGQMFSVDDSPASNDAPSTAFYVGFEPISFSYEGSAAAPGAGNYDFTGSVIRLQLDTEDINIYLGGGGTITGLDEHSYFDAGIKFAYGISLLQTQSVSLQIPLQLHTSLTSVRNTELALNPAPEFDQGTFDFGAGLRANARLAPNTRIGVSAIPRYGFSFSTREQNGAGSILAAEGEARLYLDRLFGDAGLSFGYSYDYRDFDVDAEALRYSSAAHSLLIGITF